MRTKSRSICLRMVSLADSHALLELIKDIEVSSAIPGSEHLKTIKDVEQYIADTWNKASKQTEFHFAVCDTDNKFLGMCAIYEIDTAMKMAHIGYWIGKKYWGKGSGSKAVSGLIDIAFKNLKISNLMAQCSRDNTRSIRLLKRLGFEQSISNSEMLTFRLHR